jgi:hypothetical protein
LEIKRLPQKPTVKQQLKVARMRARLGKQVKDFLHMSNAFLPTLQEVDLKPFEEERLDTPEEEYVEPEEAADCSLDEDLCCEEEEEAEALSVLPEAVVLPLPSNIISDKLRSSLQHLTTIERELRKGQANDALEGVRIGLANKSLLLLTEVNQSKSTKQSTRAWASVRNAQSQILFHASGYQRAWQALKCIGTPEDLVIYQKLEEKHLVVVKDITKAKRFGQGNDHLAWFWHIGPSKDALTGEWMEECEPNFLFWVLCLMLIYLVYRVNWLRAKARVDRWLEEETLVKYEMQWTIGWFQYQANIWKERSNREDGNLPLGHKSYCTKQEKLWNAFVRKASQRFGLYISLK